MDSVVMRRGVLEICQGCMQHGCACAHPRPWTCTSSCQKQLTQLRAGGAVVGERERCAMQLRMRPPRPWRAHGTPLRRLRRRRRPHATARVLARPCSLLLGLRVHKRPPKRWGPWARGVARPAGPRGSQGVRTGWRRPCWASRARGLASAVPPRARAPHATARVLARPRSLLPLQGSRSPRDHPNVEDSRPGACRPGEVRHSHGVAPLPGPTLVHAGSVWPLQGPCKTCLAGCMDVLCCEVLVVKH